MKSIIDDLIKTKNINKIKKILKKIGSNEKNATRISVPSIYRVILKKINTYLTNQNITIELFLDSLEKNSLSTPAKQSMSKKGSIFKTSKKISRRYSLPTKLRKKTSSKSSKSIKTKPSRRGSMPSMHIKSFKTVPFKMIQFPFNISKVSWNIKKDAYNWSINELMSWIGYTYLAYNFKNSCFIYNENDAKEDVHEAGQLLWESWTDASVIKEDGTSQEWNLYGRRPNNILKKSYHLNKKHINKKLDTLIEDNELVKEQIPGTLFVHQQFIEKFQRCLENTNKRFIIIPLKLLHTYKWWDIADLKKRVKDSRTAHANILIYDKKTKKLERFDPNGNTISLEEYSYKPIETHCLDNAILECFIQNKYINNEDDYYSPEMVCPKIGAKVDRIFQTIQGSEQLARNSGFTGSCASWCMFYIHIRLTNPDLPRTTVIKKSIELLKKSDKTFTEFISNYIKYIYYINTLLKKNVSINDILDKLTNKK